MAILVKGLLIFCAISSIRAQYQSRKHHSVSDGFSPIIIGHHQKDLEPLEGKYQPRYVDRPFKSEKIRLNPGVVKEFDTDSSVAEEEDNNREYTVGAHFQVTHPTSYITPKKDSSLKVFDPSQASYSFTSFHIPSDKKYKEPPSRSFKTKITKKPLFKPALPQNPIENISPSRSPSDPIDFYELPKGIDQDPRDFKPNFKLQDVPNLYPLQKQYGGVASKGQIEKYLEDQQKYIDEAVELQLLNDPNPASKGKYQQFLKSKDDERIEKEYEDMLKKAPLVVFDENIPKISQSHKLTSKRPLKKIQLKGLGSYRTLKTPDAYHFSIDY